MFSSNPAAQSLRSSHREAAKPYVMLVFGDAFNLLQIEEAIVDRYELALFSTGEACLTATSIRQPDLILLDSSIYDISCFEVCEKLKQNSKTADIPIIFITKTASLENERQALQVGAVDYITKPFTDSILLARIDSHLSLHNAKQEIKLANQFLQQEREYIENIINSMREDRRFVKQNLRQNLSPLEVSNGDIVLSALKEQNKHHLLVGDFTGHGLTAAIAGPLVTSMFYAKMNAEQLPVEMIEQINDELFHKLPVQKFLAATYVNWLKTEQRIHIYNHGMPPALLFKTGKTPIVIGSNNLPMGIVEQMDQIDFHDFEFAEGDRLFIFTDGAMDPRNGEKYFSDEEGITRLISKHLDSLDGSEYVLDKLKTDLAKIQGADDVTFVELKACY